MTYTLRPYQQASHDAVIDWIKTCLDPCLVEAATGSGKSLLVAAIAASIHAMSGKKILCIAPSSELVEQNFEKYLATGEKASIFSASLGKKEMRHNVIFGTPGTISNQVRKFGKQFAAVIIDEAHGVTPTLMKIVDHMRSQNPKLRVIGLSATPFRLGTGYIYGNHYQHGAIDETQAIDPFFHSLVYSIGARELIDAGYLTPPVFEQTAEHYDTSGLTQNRNGQWSSVTVDAAFVGRGRKTSAIVADIVNQAQHRYGVMIFAATVQHAQEIMESLPPSLSRIVTGGTDKKERRQILADFKAQRVKYLVSVSTLTTGFDSSHVDVVAIMRATESVSLLQQIIGRGLRLHDGKKDCLILDYAENIERHCPGGDVFDPDIRAKRKTPSEPMEVKCPMCAHVNTFGARKNDEGFNVDSEGYFTDLAGQRIEVAEGQPLPAHYGRRCQGEVLIAGHHTQCGHKWSYKECPECGGENDIAARYCSSCRGELVDPNERLQEIAAQVANDPYRLRISEISSMTLSKWSSLSSGNETLKIDYEIEDHPYRVTEWISPKSKTTWRQRCRQIFKDLEPPTSIDDSLSLAYNRPDRVAFRKNQGNKFFNVISVG